MIGRVDPERIPTVPEGHPVVQRARPLTPKERIDASGLSSVGKRALGDVVISYTHFLESVPAALRALGPQEYARALGLLAEIIADMADRAAVAAVELTTTPKEV